MSTPVPYILATAGHVDHGKSSLVKALTGTDPDRLPEEKSRGITIDLGFAHLDLPSPAPIQPPATYRLGIVDVPGHEDFVKNMVAGVGSIDLALLVVAADDGWMPQTEEHLQILLYLGVAQAVVAVTKVDLASDFEAVRRQVREKLAATPYAEAEIVGTSTVSGQGLEVLRRALAEALSRTPPQRDAGKPRLPVDRAFTLRGIGTVVTGTLTGGSLRRGQSVVVQPAGRAARIRNIQSHNQDLESVPPGSRVALNLPDVGVDSGIEAGAARSVGRGDVVTLAEAGISSDTLDVLLERSGRAADAPPLKDGTRVNVHHGSAGIPARVRLADGAPLAPGGRGLAQLRLESPIFVLAGDRFILRDWPQQHTIGGGVVLDPLAQRKGFRTPQRRSFLEARAAAPDATTFIRTELSRRGAARRAALPSQSGFSADEIAAALSHLASEASVVLLGDWAVDAGRWSAARAAAAAAIDAHHSARPEQIGLSVSELRQALGASLPLAEVFDALLEDLCRMEFTRSGATVRRTAHRPALPPHLQFAGSRVHAALSAKPLEPPSRTELARDALSQQAIKFFLDTGQAVSLSDELVLLSDAVAAATQTIRDYLSRHGQATASELRQQLNTTRRVLVPLLEHLDHQGVTLRKGDVRVLR